MAAHAYFDVVHLIVSAAQSVQQGQADAVWTTFTPHVARWRSSGHAENLRPLLDLMPVEGSEPPSQEETALALRASIQNLAPLVTEMDRIRLAHASARLRGIIGEHTGAPISGFFVTDSDGPCSAEEAPLCQEMREDVFISIGGAAHDADKTMTALSTSVQIARRYHPEILSLALGTDTVDHVLEEIETQVRTLLELVRELRARIDSMRQVRAETTDDLKALLLSGGYVDRIFSRLAQVRLFLGRVRRRMAPIFSESGSENVRTGALKLFERVESSIELTKLSASLFRGLCEVRHVYNAANDAMPVSPHAYLRPTMIQSVVGVKIDIDLSGLDPAPWDVRGPHKRIWQIVTNLASNARQAMEDFGALKISTENIRITEEDEPFHHYRSRKGKTGDFVLLKVKDTGPGIPTGKISEIFDLYHSGAGSSGYGLAVTRKFVHGMGGFIGVDSSPQGTTFYVYLPRA